MPIIVRGKICRLEYLKVGEGFICRCMFLLAGSDLAAPAWTEDLKHAEIREWKEAEEWAEKLNGHAVVVSLTAETATERAKPLCGASREDRLENYRAELERRRLF